MNRGTHPGIWFAAAVAIAIGFVLIWRGVAMRTASAHELDFLNGHSPVAVQDRRPQHAAEDSRYLLFPAGSSASVLADIRSHLTAARGYSFEHPGDSSGERRYFLKPGVALYYAQGDPAETWLKTIGHAGELPPGGCVVMRIQRS